MKLFTSLFLFTVLAASGTRHAAVAAPVIIVLKAGDIALEGQIQSVDQGAHTMVLQVVAFTNSTGKRAALVTPKTKTVHVMSGASIKSQGDGAPVPLADLHVGDEVVVVGQDKGSGQPLDAALIACTPKSVVAPVPVADSGPEGPDPMTPTDLVPLLPGTQRVFGVSLRPVYARFMRKNVLYKNLKDTTPILAMRWKLQTPQPTGSDLRGEPLRSYGDARLIRLNGPNGEPLDLPQIYPYKLTAPNSTSFVAMSDNIDPRWPYITATWQIRDPQTSDEDAGCTVSHLKWDIPEFPMKKGEQVDVGGSQTAETGTKIVIAHIERDDNRLLFFVKRTTMPPNPDTIADVQVESLTGDKGNYRGPISQYLKSVDGFYYLTTSVIPPDDAGPLKLTIRMTETTPSLQNPAHFKQISFRIPVADVWKTRPLPQHPSTAVTVNGMHTHAKLDLLTQDPGRKIANLWIEAPDDLKDTDDPSTRVYLHEPIASNRLNWTKRTAQEEGQRYLHEDGTLALPGEAAQPLVLGLEEEKGGLHFERGNRQRFFGTLRDIPLLQTTGILDLGDKAINDGPITIRRVVHFDDRFNNAIVLQGVTQDWRFAFASGNAVVMEIASPVPTTEVNFRLRNIADSLGRFWTENSLVEIYPGDATRPGAPDPKFETLILPDYDSSVVKISVEYSLVETQWSGGADIASVKAP